MHLKAITSIDFNEDENSLSNTGLSCKKQTRKVMYVHIATKYFNRVVWDLGTKEKYAFCVS